ncbi:MAG: HAMP domain-containing protein [Anaerolineaceae bacterium]|nr:HAMP domain-containing protein [Anaerolineaceae bacterium]
MKKKKLSIVQSLRGILILLMVLLATLPMLVVGFIGSRTTASELAAVKSEQLKDIALVQSEVIQDWLDARVNEVTAFSRVSYIKTMSYQLVEATLDQYMLDYPYYEALNVIQPSGDVLYSTEGAVPNLKDRGYFIAAMNGETVITDPLISRVSGHVVIFFATPIYDKNDEEIIGVMQGLSNTDDITALMKIAYPGETGDVYTINNEGYYTSASRYDEQILEAGLVETRTEIELLAEHIAAQDVMQGNSGTAEYENVLGDDVVAGYAPVSSMGWGVIVEQTTEEAYRSVTTLENILLIATILIIVFVVFLSIAFSAGLTKPIEFLSSAADALANGDILLNGLNLDMKAKVAKRRDEVGMTAQSMDRMIDYFKEMTDVANHVADGDLTDEVVPKSEYDAFGNAFAKMITNLRALIGEVKENADVVTDASLELRGVAEQTGMASNQVAATIQQVATGTSDQAGSASKAAATVQNVSNAIGQVGKGVQEQTVAVENVSVVTSEISEIIQKVSENVKMATTGAGKATDLSKSGAETVEETINGMKAIQEKVRVSAEKIQEMGKRSEEIGAIVETIQDIASQTNLLALNAAIEAARAGEHGKGFAVVADEVRKLAERSSVSTKEIDDLITGIQKTVAEAVVAMDEGSREVKTGMDKAGQAGNALAEILSSVGAVHEEIIRVEQAAETMMDSSKTLVNSVDMVTNVIDANRSAVDEMATMSNEMTLSIETIASVAEENSAAVEEVSASTEELSAQAQEVAGSANSMLEMAGRLKELVASFVLLKEQESTENETEELADESA